MKLLFLNTLYAPNFVGGAERSVQSLAETLVQLGHSVTVVSTHAKKTEQSWFNGVKVYYLGLQNVYWPFRAGEPPLAQKLLWHTLDSYNPGMRREVARVLTVEQPDLVHTHNLAGFSVAAWRAAAQLELPLVHTLRDHYLLCPKATMYRSGNCRGQCLDCKVLSAPKNSQTNLVNHVVGISAYMLERHLSFGHFKQTPKTVIPNSYEAPELYEATHEIKVTPPPTPKLRLGFLGRVEQVKGIELFLKACQELPANEVELFIGGTGQESYLGQLAGRYPLANVTYLGYVRPADFFAHIDVLVVPSLLHEAMGRVIVEAYAHGVSVVASNRGGIPENVEEGKTGFIFEPDKPETLRAALRRFICEPKLVEQMRGACLESAKTFLPARIAKAYLNIYAKTLSETPQVER